MKRSYLTSIIALSLGSFRPGDGLELSYASADEVPQEFASLYTEKDGKHVLTGINGLKTIEDVTRLQTSLNNERNEHKQTKQKYHALNAYGSVEDILASLDRIPELEAGASKAPEDIEKLVAARIAPVNRNLETLKGQLEESQKAVEQYRVREARSTIADHVRKACVALKVKDEAIEDAIMYAQAMMTVDDDKNVVTKDGLDGVTPFLTAEDWLREMIPNRPHWMKESVGGGANGGKGTDVLENPYSYENWNMTKQMQLYRQNPAKARQMAERYGVDPLNPVRPAKKS